MKFDKRSISIDGFTMACSVQSDGNMDFRFSPREAVVERRTNFIRDIFGAVPRIRYMELSHSSSIRIANAENSLDQTIPFSPIIDTDFPGYYDGTDCYLSQHGSHLFGMVSADCIPMGIVHKGADVFGLAHIGLLGLVNGNIGNILRSIEALGAPFSETRFIMGPAISGDLYNLSMSGLWVAIERQVLERTPEFFKYLDKKADGLHVDIRRAATSQLQDFGVALGQIYIHARNTGDVEYYSNFIAKRDKCIDGRFLTVIGRTPENGLQQSESE